MKRTLTVATAAAISLGAVSAQAEEFGVQGTAAFSADRLFAFHSTRVVRERPAPQPDDQVTYTGIGFGWRSQFQASPFDVPRLAFDYFVIDGLNIGGSLGYASVDDDNDQWRGRRDRYSAFLLAPRVGYVWMFSEVAGFWLRGGFTYHSWTRDNPDPAEPDQTISGLALTVEPTFVLSPVEHFAFVLGPTLDWDVSGEHDPGPAQWDNEYRSIGIQFGLMGWL